MEKLKEKLYYFLKINNINKNLPQNKINKIYNYLY